MPSIRRVLHDESGQGLGEYGLILGLIAIACFTVLATLGTQISSALTSFSAEL